MIVSIRQAGYMISTDDKRKIAAIIEPARGP